MTSQRQAQVRQIRPHQAPGWDLVGVNGKRFSSGPATPGVDKVKAGNIVHNNPQERCLSQPELSERSPPWCDCWRKRLFQWSYPLSSVLPGVARASQRTAGLFPHDGITPLAMGGARGVLFQITLLEYGYTFVGKGPVLAFISDLQHEAAVYERSAPCQGKSIPVFLGAIDLRLMNKTHYFIHRVYVVNMIFMSWSGHCLDKVQLCNNGMKQLEAKTRASLTGLHERGVIHKDIRAANTLYDPRTDSVVLIDFERAELLDKPRHPLLPLVPNKRKHGPGASQNKVLGLGSDQGRRSDLVMLESVFGSSGGRSQRLVERHHRITGQAPV
ncbi:unnamed protein product [Clonostachys byssicola]|uniref:Protein kinase domain-containing protein n=1 Tax=Clonostachys byssicola TaxID=160290 RepID=A0A9N9YE44_9HYPO|nr:unnamed protein product [Clonostachys byssicola]